MICDSCKTLESDLNLPNEIYGKNDNEFLEKSHTHEHLNEDGNEAKILNGRLKLSKSEVSLLSKGLKVIPKSNTIDKAKLKIELEAFGRMLRLKWFFRDDEKEFNPDKFKPKSIFNPRNKDAAIEIYLSSLEEKLMSIEIPKDKYNNLTRNGELFLI